MADRTDDPWQDPTIDSIDRDRDGLFVLTILRGDQVESVALPRRGVLAIGRATDNQIVVPDGTISRRHATLRVGTQLFVTDLGSTSGVRVRGQRVASGSEVEVAPGEAFELGAVTFVVRHGRAESTDARIARASTAVRTRREASADHAIADDPAMQRVFDLVRRAAAGTINVLIHGETGVGKEVVAEAIHRESPRARGPFVRLHCAALAPTLLESELFGHEKGAFTGALRDKPGLIESASGGTLLLDEVGELPMTVQVKLLRVLEERAVLRIGALKPRPLDVRFVSATHRDLRAMVADGSFRQDLFYRLNGLSLEVPSLRDRPGDVDPLVDRYARRGPLQLPVAIAADVRRRLREYTWPGNVRELRNVLERAVLLAGDGAITLEHLPPEIAAPIAFANAAAAATIPPPPPAFRAIANETPAGEGPAALRGELRAIERQRMVDALAACHGNQTRAAEMLGMPRRTFTKRLREYDIPGPRRS